MDLLNRKLKKSSLLPLLEQVVRLEISSKCKYDKEKLKKSRLKLVRD